MTETHSVLTVFVLASILIVVTLAVAPFIAPLFERVYTSYCDWAESKMRKIKEWRK